jgi:hypothetical protein
VCSWGPSRLDVFARGEDFALWHTYSPDLQNWVWSEWETLGGALTSPPAAVSWGEGRIDVFVRGTDRALWHKWFTGFGWSDWESLGGALNFGPAVCSWGPGRLDVFARGTDNTIFQRTFDQGWSDWTRVPDRSPALTVALPGIAAVSWPNAIELFTWAQVPPNPNVYLVQKTYCRDRWKQYHPIGDILAVPAAPASTSTSLAVASWRDQFFTTSLDWFMRGGDNTLVHSAGRLSCGGDDSSLQEIFGPTSRGGFLTSGPAAVASSRDRIDVIVRGGDNALYHMWL